jgi:hypothetical protein
VVNSFRPVQFSSWLVTFSTKNKIFSKMMIYVLIKYIHVLMDVLIKYIHELFFLSLQMQ